MGYSQDDAILSLKAQLQATRDSFRRVDILNRIAMLSYEQNGDSTLWYANRARAMAIRIGYPKGIADAIDNFGVYFDINGNPELSLRYYSDAYSRYVRLGDSAEMVQALMNIAMVYNSRGDEARAVSHYEEAMRLGGLLRYDSIVSLVIYNYILQYPGMFTADSTALYIDSSIHIARRYHDIRLLLAIDQLKASDYLRQGRRDTAITLLRRSLDSGLRAKLYFMSLDILEQLGDIYAGTDSLLAARYYGQALDIVRQKNYVSYELDVTTKLLEFYRGRKDSAKALVYAAALLELYKRKQELDNKSGIDYVSYALQEEELRAVEQRSVYERRLLWLETIACLLILVICGLLWRNARKSRRTNAILKEQYQMVSHTADALEVSNRDYARLIRVIAHDLQNPIAVISSVMGKKLLEDGLASTDREWLSLVDDASKRCLQLIGELLESDFSIRAQDLQRSSVDVIGLLHQTVNFLSYRAEEKQQKLVTLETTLPLILADKEKLTRVLDNLVINAIKFSEPGGVIELAALADEREVVFSVRDHGIGIPKDIALLLFIPAVNSIRRKGTAGEPSFGWGLYICRQIVEAHGGRIWFISEPGRGTVFYIALPK